MLYGSGRYGRKLDWLALTYRDVCEFGSACFVSAWIYAACRADVSVTPCAWQAWTFRFVLATVKVRSAARLRPDGAEPTLEVWRMPGALLMYSESTPNACSFSDEWLSRPRMSSITGASLAGSSPNSIGWMGDARAQR